jgi:hypothetical protein
MHTISTPLLLTVMARVVHHERLKQNVHHVHHLHLIIWLFEMLVK